MNGPEPRPWDIFFICPVSPELVPTPGESRLDNLVVVDLRENRESIGLLYSADGLFTLICMDEMSFERILEDELARGEKEVLAGPIVAYRRYWLPELAALRAFAVATTVVNSVAGFEIAAAHVVHPPRRSNSASCPG